MSIATRIRTIREVRNLKQDYMADRLGISQNAYSRLENGQTRITLERLQRVSELLDTPVEEFLNDADQITLNMRTRSGANGYHVVQHQECSAELMQRTLDVLAELVKEQQRQNALLAELVSRPRG